jgi:hypothetical protein
MTIGLIIGLWFACGVVAWGLMYGYFTNKYKYPDQDEWRTSHIVFAFAGPMALLAGLVCLWQFNGLKNIFRYGFKL